MSDRVITTDIPSIAWLCSIYALVCLHRLDLTGEVPKAQKKEAEIKLGEAMRNVLGPDSDPIEIVELSKYLPTKD